VRPRVSVVLPVRDARTSLPSALRSIARQTLVEFECLVVDDGSRDGSRSVAEGFARSDPRFRVIAAERSGLVAALNQGLAAARTDWIARMDADDVMARERLAQQLHYLESHPEVSAVGCHVRLFPRRALGEGMRSYEAWLRGITSPREVRCEAFVECPVPHPTLFVRRDALPPEGYRDLGWPEDYDLVLRMLATGHEVGILPRRLLAWRHGRDRLSQRDPRYRPAAFTACKAAFLATGLLSGAATYVLWGYGGTGRALRKALARHDRHPSHVVELHPGRLGNRIHGAPVIGPDQLPDVVPRQPVVVSVAGAGPRSRIRSALGRMGFRELDDFVCAA
jgi:glycosyltransferase involved in cell wall biosynthesis